MDELKKIPPVTRFLCGVTIVETVTTMLEIVSVYRVVYARQLAFGKGEYWRIFTSFFYGGTGFAFLFDMMMLYRNSNSLEGTQYSRRSHVYGWQVLICSIGIFFVNMPFGAHFHHRQLLICLTYLICAIEPEAVVSLFGLISMKQQYFPYALVAMPLLEGAGLNAATQAFTGILVGHMWFALEHAPERRAQRHAGRGPAGFMGILYSIWDRISQPPGFFKLYIVGSGDNTERPDQGERRAFRNAQAPRGRTLGDAGAPPAANTSGHNWGQGSRLGSG